MGGGTWQLKCEKFLTSYHLVLTLMITLLNKLCQQLSHCLPLGVWDWSGALFIFPKIANSQEMNT